MPWNIALDSVLQAQDLGVQVNGTILRVAEKNTLAGEAEKHAKIRDSQLGTSPLYTELIRLNYARAKDGAVQGSTSRVRPCKRPER